MLISGAVGSETFAGYQFFRGKLKYSHKDDISILNYYQDYNKVLNEEKGEKVKVFKFKSKSRYRRHRGFRPQYSRILIEKISSK